jgi:putative ABC transport system permease protein
MKGALFLGWRYLFHHRLKSVVLLAAVTLMMFLPSAIRLLVSDSAEALTERAVDTPMLVGARGSQLELVLNALYFHADRPPDIPHRVLNEVGDSGLAKAIPLNTRFMARGAPIVGTNLDYFQFRGLRMAEGRMLGLLGECVLGGRLARELGVTVGDSLVSSPETVFDLAGVYPLKMKIVGVLETMGTADDDAVFVDLRTTWVIQGLGHGHQDLQDSDAGGAILSRRDGTITANAALVQYNEITPENVGAFHFHGDISDFPLTAVIAVPPDAKSGTLLQGRYASEGVTEQLLVPRSVLEDLLNTVFTVQNYVILGLTLLSLATVAVIILVFMLSQQLRNREFYTLRRMGASRPYIALLAASEIGFVFLASLFFSFALIWFARRYATEFLLTFLSF